LRFGAVMITLPFVGNTVADALRTKRDVLLTSLEPASQTRSHLIGTPSPGLIYAAAPLTRAPAAAAIASWHQSVVWHSV